MDKNILQQEQSHLELVVLKAKQAKQSLENLMNSLGAYTLEQLKEMRNETSAADMFVFMEELSQKHAAMNLKDKYKRLEELDSTVNEPYFSRIDLKNSAQEHQNSQNAETTELYIGKFGLTDYITNKPVVIDWRAKVASIYYRYRYPQKNVTYETPMGVETRDLMLKRTYEIEKSELVKFYNNDLQLDETQIISDKITTRTGGVLEDIIETIQENQLDIIEADPRKICIVQGCVGSGKSTVAIHKLSHIFFNFPDLIKPERALLLAKNQILVGYLSTLFPKLGIFDITYKTLRDLIIHVLFREKIKIQIDLDQDQDVSGIALEDINLINTEVENLFSKYKQKIANLFLEPKFESFGGYVFSTNQSLSENFMEQIQDLEEELDYQKEKLNDYPNSPNAWLYKENIKNITKLIKLVRDLRDNALNTEFHFLLKLFKVDAGKKLGYKATLIYLYLYSKVFGFNHSYKYQYCIVDEGQDLGVIEYAVLGALVLNGRFCILGDLNQSYVDEGLTKWETIAEVIPDAKEAQIFELDTNYRSTRPIINFANNILGKFTNTYLPKSINRIGPEPKIISVKTNDEIIKTFENEIKSELHNINKSIGVVCFGQELFDKACQVLSSSSIEKDKLIILDSSIKIHYIPQGVYVSRFEDCKGLEFGKVYVLGVNINNLPNFKHAKKAFVSVTRAMNELTIIDLE